MCRRFDSAPRHHSPAASPSFSRTGPLPAPRYAGPGSRPPPRGAAGEDIAAPVRGRLASRSGPAAATAFAGSGRRTFRRPGVPDRSPPSRRWIAGESPPRRRGPRFGAALLRKEWPRRTPRSSDLPRGWVGGRLPRWRSSVLRRTFRRSGVPASRAAPRRVVAAPADPRPRRRPRRGTAPRGRIGREDSPVVRSAPAGSDGAFRDGVRRFLPVRAASFRRPGPRLPAVSLPAGEPGRRYREGEPAPLVAVVVVWPSWVR